MALCQVCNGRCWSKKNGMPNSYCLNCDPTKAQRQASYIKKYFNTEQGRQKKREANKRYRKKRYEYIKRLIEEDKARKEVADD